jgi:hypothetical protein
MPSTFSDLAEHTGTLVALISTLLIICSSLIVVVYRIVFKIGESLKTDILAMIKTLDNKIDEVWSEISKIRDRQVTLREVLPKEYMRLEGPGYKLIIEGITRIETHFEQFSQDCRDGKCGRKSDR